MLRKLSRVPRDPIQPQRWSIYALSLKRAIMFKICENTTLSDCVTLSHILSEFESKCKNAKSAVCQK
jgi:hypothetical protein